MNTRDTLLAFSEWLESQGFINDADSRTFEQLAEDFIEHWELKPAGAPLAGRWDQHDLGYATTYELIGELMARAEVSKVSGETWPLYRTVDSQ